jgi:non-specific protein-tyrosine kinase
MTPTNRQNDGLSLRAYLRVVARRKWVILALAVVCCASALAYSLTRTPLYMATAQLIYEPQVNIADLSAGSSVDSAQRSADLESVATLLSSRAVGDAADAQLGDLGDTWYTVSAKTQLAADNSGNYSSIVLVTAVSPDADAAAKAANAFAVAFVAWRQQREQDRLRQAATVVQATLDTYDTEAARASTEYLMLQQQYRNLQILKQTATGNFSVIVQATAPSAPFSPRVVRTAGIGMAGGLVLGLLLALLLEQFDTRLRSEDQILALLPYPVLGRIPRAAKKEVATGGVVSTLSQPTGPVAESFRMLRSNLDFVNVDRGVRTLILTSSAQGEGKSIAICNLAVSLALSGKRVALVDGDLRSPHVHTYLGLSNAVGLSAVLGRRATLDAALVRMPLVALAERRTAQPLLGTPQASERAAGVVEPSSADAGDASDQSLWARSDSDSTQPLLVLTSGVTPPNAGELIASSRMKTVIDTLATAADIVLVDAPAMLVVGDTAALASSVDGLVYLVDANIARRPMLERAAEQLEQLPCLKLGVVLMADTSVDHYYTYRTESPSTRAQHKRRRRT